MDQEILAKARLALKEKNLRGALLSDPFSMTWLTGYAAPILTGPNPFEGGPALAWLDPERIVLLVSDAEQGAAAVTGAETVVYTSYQTESRLQPGKEQAEQLRRLINTA